MINLFPIEIVETIFSNINVKSLLYLRLISKQWNLIITSHIKCDIIISGNIKHIKNIQYYKKVINFNNKYGIINVENLLIEKPFLYNIQRLEYIIKDIYDIFNINKIFLDIEIYNCSLSDKCMELIFNQTNSKIYINNNYFINLDKLNIYNKNIKELFIKKTNYNILNFPNLNILGIHLSSLINIKKYNNNINILEFFCVYHISEKMVNNMIDLIKLNGVRKIILYFDNINLCIIEKYLSELDNLTFIDYILINENVLDVHKYKKVGIIQN